MRTEEGSRGGWACLRLCWALLIERVLQTAPLCLPLLCCAVAAVLCCCRRRCAALCSSTQPPTHPPCHPPLCPFRDPSRAGCDPHSHCAARLELHGLLQGAARLLLPLHPGAFVLWGVEVFGRWVGPAGPALHS